MSGVQSIKDGLKWEGEELRKWSELERKAMFGDGGGDDAMEDEGMMIGGDVIMQPRQQQQSAPSKLAPFLLGLAIPAAAAIGYYLNKSPTPTPTPTMVDTQRPPFTFEVESEPPE